MRIIFIILSISCLALMGMKSKSVNYSACKIALVDTEKILGILRPPNSIILASGGESNEPGEADNDDASPAELAVRTTLIWNINIERFQKLQIGYNNLGTFAHMHGFELQIANLKDSLDFGNNNLYLIKAGQGTTRTADWMPDKYLYQRMIYRYDKAISQVLTFHSEAPELWMFWTLGINDMFAGYPAADFKSDCQVIFDALKLRYPTLKIIIHKFNTFWMTYNTVIQELDDENDFVYAVFPDGATYLPDNTHLDYNGYKVLGRGIRDIINAN